MHQIMPFPTHFSTLKWHLNDAFLSHHETTQLYIYIIEGSLEVKLPTIWRDEKQSREEAERRERLEERRSEEKESEEKRCRCAKR